MRNIIKGIHTTRAFLENYKRHIPTVALFTGFIWDNLTLGRPDRFFDNAVLLFYVVLVGVSIVFLNKLLEKESFSIPLSLLILIQFSFGNLASALFVLYGQSATLVGNWPFLLLLMALLIGNEFLRSKYELVRFHITIYYLLLFSYLMLVVPVLLHSIGASIFLLSGILSVVVIAGYVALIYVFAPRVILNNLRQLVASVAIVFFGINVLYFSNLIPPVPLALKDIGIYHSVTRNDLGGYNVTYEKGRWYEFWKDSDKVFHYVSSNSAYCFSSVFAPTQLKTPVYHIWAYYNKDRNRWEDSTRISFPIVGGRDEGYRGFSTKSALMPGLWRCSVETERGALIGRTKFEVVSSDKETSLITEVR